jgi:hypothetical protein
MRRANGFGLALKAPRKLAGGKPPAPPPETRFRVEPAPAGRRKPGSRCFRRPFRTRRLRPQIPGAATAQAVLPPANFRRPSGTAQAAPKNRSFNSTENSGELNFTRKMLGARARPATPGAGVLPNFGVQERAENLTSSRKKRTGRWVGQLFFQFYAWPCAHRPVIARWISPVANERLKLSGKPSAFSL